MLMRIPENKCDCIRSAGLSWYCCTSLLAEVAVCWSVFGGDTGGDRTPFTTTHPFDMQ